MVRGVGCACGVGGGCVAVVGVGSWLDVVGVGLLCFSLGGPFCFCYCSSMVLISVRSDYVALSFFFVFSFFFLSSCCWLMLLLRGAAVDGCRWCLCWPMLLLLPSGLALLAFAGVCAGR